MCLYYIAYNDFLGHKLAKMISHKRDIYMFHLLPNFITDFWISCQERWSKEHNILYQLGISGEIIYDDLS